MLSVLVALQASCGRNRSAANGDRPRAVCTTGIVADLVNNLAGGRFEVVAIMGDGVDPHLYKPSPGDVRLLESGSIVFASGLHLEGRMIDALEGMKQAGSNGRRVVMVGDGIDGKRLLHVGEGEHAAADPHVWFDVSLWADAGRAVTSELIAMDSVGREVYESRAAEYQAQLAALHEWVGRQIATIPPQRRVLVTAHDAFGYYGRAYGLEVLAVQGVSTDSEAGIGDINRLVDRIVGAQVPAVFFESSVPQKAVKAVIEGCAAKGHTVRVGGELFSDALGAAGTHEGTYIGVVEHNTRTIVKALGGQYTPFVAVVPSAASGGAKSTPTEDASPSKEAKP
ncbi:MAG: zinc ABC transporter substrate-binding protein [Phycisphaerales bacterium]|nr:zinc ABC transporter substrate-binding protein [Phycisphaerales bacterium]